MRTMGSCAIEFDLTTRSFKNLSMSELEHLDLFHTDKIYWIHSNLNEIDTHEKLIKKCQLSEAVLKLCDQEDIIPVAIDTEEALTLQIQAPISTEVHRKTEASCGSLIIQLTPTFCFTASRDAVPVLFDFIENSQKSLRYAKTPCFIMFLMLDSIVNDYARLLFNFDVIVDRMDLRVRKTHKNIYHEVIKIRQQLLKIKRNLIALREILLRISGRNISVVSTECRSSLSKLANHTHLVVHEVDSVRDMLNSLLQQIENNLMQKLNNSIKILTAISMIFLPLTLITGIYGMNFHRIPELEWHYGYFYALGLMVTCAVIILFIFKKMKWFD